MPQRYTITRSAEDLKSELGINIPENYRPRYNAAPAQLLPLVTATAPEGLSFFYWGTIPGWSGNKTISTRIINIHVDPLLSKPVNRRLMVAQPCIIPADGFYYWKHVGKKTLIPYRVEWLDKSLFFFPGIWEEFEDENDQIHHTFKMIVRSPGVSLAGLTDTEPVMMDPRQAISWLESVNDPEMMAETLKKHPSPGIHSYPVSSRINRQEVDEPGLISEVDSMNQFGNYSLFD